MYKIMDVTTAKNLQTGEYVSHARTSVAPSFAGYPPDNGNRGKLIFDEAKMSMVRASQEAMSGSPEQPGFVFHEKLGEIEYMMSSTSDVTYPDGTLHPVVEGHCIYHHPGQPHKMFNTSEEIMELCVGINGSSTGRFGVSPGVHRGKWEQDHHYYEEGHYKIAYCPHSRAFVDHAMGIRAHLVFESSGLCFADVFLAPGKSFPEIGLNKNENADEMLLVLSGSGLVIYPDRTYFLKRDIAMYHFENQGYKLVNTGSEDLHLLVYFSSDTFSQLKRTAYIPE